MANSHRRPGSRAVDEAAVEADPTDVAAQHQEADADLEPDVEADDWMPLEAEPADVAEQRRTVGPRLSGVGESLPLEADPADVADQQRVEVIDDDGNEP